MCCDLPQAVAYGESRCLIRNGIVRSESDFRKLRLFSAKPMTETTTEMMAQDLYGDPDFPTQVEKPAEPTVLLPQTHLKLTRKPDHCYP